MDEKDTMSGFPWSSSQSGRSVPSPRQTPRCPVGSLGKFYHGIAHKREHKIIISQGGCNLDSNWGTRSRTKPYWMNWTCIWSRTPWPLNLAKITEFYTLQNTYYTTHESLYQIHELQIVHSTHLHKHYTIVWSKKWNGHCPIFEIYVLKKSII